MPKLSINKGGTWYTAKKFWVNKGGTWYLAKKMWINKGGTWQLITFITPTGFSYYTSNTGTSNSITWQTDGDTSGSLGAWLDPVGAGNGTDFWISFTKNTGSASLSGGRTFGTWYRMDSSNIALTLTSSLGVFNASTGQYHVSDNAGSTTLVTGDWEIYLNE